MEQPGIVTSTSDLDRLKELLEGTITLQERDREYLESLRNELERAHIVDPAALPDDVVTMNSRVRLKDMDTAEEKNYSLVFPSEADMAQNKISILAPIGTAILGYRAGETVDWLVPAGRRTVRIQEILYQPEAAGRYDQ